MAARSVPLMAAMVLVVVFALMFFVVIAPDAVPLPKVANSIRQAGETSFKFVPILLPLYVGLVMGLLGLWADAQGPIARLREALDALRAATPILGASRGATLADLERISTTLAQSGPQELADAWHQYRATSVERLSGEKTCWNATSPPTQVLHDIGAKVSGGFDIPRILRWSAASAITLGMLGTFFGITEGLGSINFEGNGTNEVVEALSSAFWTSIVGLIVALFVSMLAGTTEREFDGLEQRIHDAFENLLPPVTVESLLFDLLDTRVRPGTDDHVNFREEIVLLLAAQTAQAEALAGTVDALATRVSDRLVESLNGLATSLSSPITQAAEAGAKAVQETLVTSLEPVREQFGVFAETVGQLSNDIRTLGDGVQESAEQARAVTESCRDALIDATSRFEHVVMSLAGFEALGSQLHAAQAELERALLSFEERGLQILATHAATLEETHQAAEAAAAAAGGMRDAAASLSTSFEGLGVRVEQSTEAAEAAASAIASNADRLDKAGDGLAELLRREQGLLEASNERVEAITKAAAVVGKATADLAQAVATLDRALPKLSASADMLETAADALIDLPDATRSLAETTTAFRGSLDESRLSLDQQKDMAARWGKELQAATDGQLQVYDQHMTQALHGLQTAIVGMTEIGEEFSRIADDLRKVDARGQAQR